MEHFLFKHVSICEACSKHFSYKNINLGTPLKLNTNVPLTSTVQKKSNI